MLWDYSVWIFLHSIHVPSQKIQENFQAIKNLRNPTWLLVNLTPFKNIARVQGRTQGIQQVLKTYIPIPVQKQDFLSTRQFILLIWKDSDKLVISKDSNKFCILSMAKKESEIIFSCIIPSLLLTKNR